MGITALIILSIIICLFLSSLFSPIAGVIGYLCVYMLYNPNMWWIAQISNILRKPSFTAVFFIIISSVIQRNKLKWNISKREKMIYFFIGIAWFVSFVFGVEIHEQTWFYLKKLTKVSLFIFFFIRIVNSINSYKVVIWCLIIGGLFLSYQAQLIGEFSGGRLNNMGGVDFNEANSFASFLFLGVIMAGFNMIMQRSWYKKILIIPIIVLMLNTVILTQSRAVFVGIVSATIFLFIKSSGKVRKQMSLIIILGGILFFILVDPNFINRMHTIDDETNSSGADYNSSETIKLSRIDFWKASLDIFHDHPFGIGVKNFEKVIRQYDTRNPGLDAHNTYVLCYSELGILGIFFFLIIIFQAFTQLKRIRLMAKGTQYEFETEIYTLALHTVMIMYFTGTMMTHSILYSEILWIILALPICLENVTIRLLES
ncbi:MAG: O-antigen ligase family protein [Gammaproteobacteria bacterium]|nr:O-antigen ligase family protein [Gammaproteobacteria bacterium]